MILEKIKNIFGVKPVRYSISNDTMNNTNNELKEEEELPKYMSYDKTMGKYRIQKNKKHYGYFLTLDEAKTALHELETHDWDIRYTTGLPTDIVSFNEETRKYMIHKKIQGVHYNFGEYKRASAVKKKIQELEAKNWPLRKATPIKESNCPYYREKYPQGSYYYNQQYDYFYLPNTQGRNLCITASEAFQIIHLKNAGYSIKDIFEAINWTWGSSVNTVSCWYNRYQDGKMDLALNFIIKNHIVSEDMWK